MSDTRWCKSGSAPSTGQDRTGQDTIAMPNEAKEIDHGHPRR